MRSLYMRIIVTFGLALICSAFAVAWVSIQPEQAASYILSAGSLKLEVRDAQASYETGGPRLLAKYLDETDAALLGTRYFTDSSGRDLVSGVDRSSMRTTNMYSTLDKLLGTSRKSIIVQPSLDNRYRLIDVPPPPSTFTRFRTVLLLIPLGIVLMGWSLSMGIVSPLLRVAKTVDRFGAGDLSARISSDRKDEIGNLARSFNYMADRIETLLIAERRLLQDVSHELRSPLARLGFAAELMKDAIDPQAALNRMRREIHRLADLVGELLEVTSVEGDPSSKKVQHILIVPLIEDIVVDARFEAEARNVTIQVRLHSSAAIEGDAELLRRAIENVLRNAIRFSDTSSDVLLEAEDSPGGVMISVRDFGPGVPGGLLVRIFSPLFRVNESRDSAAGGIGLGLSIARRAVLLHHGEITAENAHPGLRVKITLPTVLS